MEPTVLATTMFVVLDAFKLEKSILVGHSLGGEELSLVATRYPNRVSALVYLEAGYPYAFDNGKGPTLKEIEDASKLRPSAPTPSETDPALASFAALQQAYTRALGFSYPEGEFRQQFTTTFSSTQNTAACAGGFRSSPMMSAAAFIMHGASDPAPGSDVFDWCGQRVRAFTEPTQQGKRHRFEFLDKPREVECNEKVHIAFREIEDEKLRLEDFLKFYAREVLHAYDGEYAPAAKTLGIKAPELRSLTFGRPLVLVNDKLKLEHSVVNRML